MAKRVHANDIITTSLDKAESRGSYLDLDSVKTREFVWSHVRLPLLSVLQVRNLMLSTTEETLRQEFSRFKPGSVERVKKLTDYAFIHYRCREDAITALGLMNGAQIDGASMEVMLAKPAGIKDGSVAARRYSSRGYLGNGNAAAGGGGETFVLHSSNGGMMGGAVDRGPPLRTVSLPTRLGNPVYTGAAGEEELHSVCVCDQLKILT